MLCKNILLILSFLLFGYSLFSQNSFIKSYGDPSFQYRASSAIQTFDGGYLLVGWAYADTISNTRDTALLIRTDYNGDILWTRYGLGWGPEEYAIDAEQTPDGGFMVLARRDLGNRGDMKVAKLNYNGTIQWKKDLNPPNNFADEVPAVMRKTSTGDFIISGTIDYRPFIMKIDTSGSVLWERTFQNVNSIATDIQETSDGGFVITGRAEISIGEDILLMKTDSLGFLMWTRVFDRSLDDIGYSIKEAHDYGFIIVGNAGSYSEILLLKTDSIGNIEWEKTFAGGESPLERGYSVVQVSDSGYVIAGRYWPGLADYDGYILKCNVDGDSLWAKQYTIPGYTDWFVNVSEASDGGLVLVGNTTNSAIGDIRSFLVKTDSEGNVIIPELSGVVFEDQNQNGIQDTTEIPLSHQLIYVQPGNYFDVTDENGKYHITVYDTGTYTISMPIPQYWQQFQPSVPNHHIVGIDSFFETLDSLDFTLLKEEIVYDLEINLSSRNPRPGFSTFYNITYRNVGTETIDTGKVKLDFPPILTLDTALTAYQNISASEIVWSFNDLVVGEERKINFYMSLNPVPGLLGDTLTTFASVLPIQIDSVPSNNVDTLNKIITGSFDPNSKEVSLMGIGAEGKIPLSTTNLTYTINFQNTGTDTAFNVILLDTLDQNLDISSIQVIAGSHDYSFDIELNRTLKFVFKDIMLPDSNTNEPMSHGFVSYSINLKPDLPVETQISNTASIYFDFNLPVLTNKIVNTLWDSISPLGGSILASTNIVKVYPNPFSNQTTFEITSENKEPFTLSVFDLFGNQVMLIPDLVDRIFQINKGNLTPGVYLYRIDFGTKSVMLSGKMMIN